MITFYCSKHNKRPWFYGARNKGRELLGSLRNERGNDRLIARSLGLPTLAESPQCWLARRPKLGHR